LGGIGPEARIVVPELVQLLRSPDGTIRYSAAGALGGIGPDACDAVPALTAALQDEAKIVRKAATAAITKINVEGSSTEGNR